MSPGKSIVWLASYPKSGNTWLRVFLANYLLNAETPVPINRIRQIGIDDSATRLYRAVAGGPFDPADVMQGLRLRGRVLRGIAGNGAAINLVKTHNANAEVFGVRLVPAELTRSAVYILRDPLDMAVSFSRHFGLSLERTADVIGRESNSSAGNAETVKQFFLGWSAHVESWTRAPAFPVLVLRYEDMLADPEAAFGRVLEHLGVPLDAGRLARATRFSDFEELQRQEDREGFVERSSKSERFFHTGRSGQWREAMPDALADKIGRQHGAVMRRFGYLDAAS